MSVRQWRAGDAVTWQRYGVMHRGTIVQTRGDGVAIIRDDVTFNRTWAHCDSLSLVAEGPQSYHLPTAC